jgi:hypothetical protein
MQWACTILYCRLLPVWSFHLFPHYLTKLRDYFRKKKVIEHECVLTFFTIYIWNISHSKEIQLNTIIHAYRFWCKVPVIVRFSWSLNFFDRFSKNTQIPDFIRSRPLGAEIFNADRQTGMTKLRVAFCNFANAPNVILHFKIKNNTCK